MANFIRVTGEGDKVYRDDGGSYTYIGDPNQVDWGNTKTVSSLPPSLTDFAKQQKSDYDALLARQKAEQDALFGQYGSAVAGQEKMTDAYTRLSTQAGLPDITKQLDIFKTQIYGIKDMLDRLDENVTNRTAGKDVSEAQRQRIVTAESNPLTQNMSRLGTAMAPLQERMTAGTNQVSTMLNLTAQDQAKALKPLELQVNAITDRFAREITGYTSNKETELSALLDSIQRGRELSDRDWQQAQDLAKEERDFVKAKELAQISKSGSSNDTSWIGPAISAMMGGGSTASSASGITASRAGVSDNVSYNGQSYTRENFARIVSQLTGKDYNSTLADIYKEFPDYKSLMGGYKSPTALLGMGG